MILLFSFLASTGYRELYFQKKGRKENIFWNLCINKESDGFVVQFRTWVRIPILGSRFPCCVLSYFSLVIVVEPSRRWWLHIGGSKMLAPHFKDEIAGLQKWLFLTGFDLFWSSLFYYDSYLWANHVHFAKKLSPDVFSWLQGGFKHFTTPFEGSPPPTQLTNPSHKSQLSRAIN